MEELKNIEGRTIESVIINEGWSDKAILVFTDGTQLTITYSEDSWGGSSYLGIEFQEKQPA